jgi:hypothetical protein
MRSDETGRMRGPRWMLAVLGAAAALGAGCKNPPTQEEMAAYKYGPRPDDYQKLIRDYFAGTTTPPTSPKLADPAGAIVEFKAGPRELFQQDTALRPLQYGWGVCVWVNEKNGKETYEGPYPMVFFIRDGTIVAVNGGSDDNVIGWRYARTGCNELGAPFVTP